jgi:hypothetical protein
MILRLNVLFINEGRKRYTLIAPTACSRTHDEE